MKTFIPLTLLFWFLYTGASPSYCQTKKELRYILKSNNSYIIDDTLKADFYLPINYKNQANPVLILFSESDLRLNPHHTNWAKFAASEGFVGVTYSPRANQAKMHFEALLEYIIKQNGLYRIDPDQVGFYAASGNVFTGLPIANENSRIKAALIYYGFAEIEHFRIDLPVLLLRAGLDNIGLNKKLDTLAFRALQANAPYTIFNNNIALHAFEDIHDENKKQVMKSSLDFLRTSMKKSVQEGILKIENNIVAMTALYNSDWSTALNAFSMVLKNNPGDTETERQMGNVHIELKEFEKAISSFNLSLDHGNWRKGEIAKKKCIAYAMLNDTAAAIAEMRILKKIGWFDESDYKTNDTFSRIVNSEEYQKFLKE